MSRRERAEAIHQKIWDEMGTVKSRAANRFEVEGEDWRSIVEVCDTNCRVWSGNQWVTEEG